MLTLTPEEARERFGTLVHGPTQTHREFAEAGGIWRPILVDGELVSYRLYELHKPKRKLSWRKRR